MFTDKSIKGLKPKQTAYRLYEKGADKGFGLKITPAGSKSFFIQFISDSGKKKFYNLCRYPSISLSDARDQCRKIRTAIHQGQDPQIEVQQRYTAKSSNCMS
jgi:Arm DNA-binding domain